MVTLPAPMLASGDLPPTCLDGWTVEPKIDGWRAIVGVNSDNGVDVRTRRGRAIGASLPELAALADLGVDVVLDGEIIVGDGRPINFYRLPGVLSARHHASSSGVCFIAFDILRLHGVELLDHPQHERRHLLEHLAELTGPHVLPIVPTYDGVDLGDVVAACEFHELEGVMVKRRDARYQPGKRSTQWRKLKCVGWAEHRARRFQRVRTRSS